MKYLPEFDCFAKDFLEQLCVLVLSIYILHQLTEFCVISRLRNEFLFIGYLQISPNGLIFTTNTACISSFPFIL